MRLTIAIIALIVLIAIGSTAALAVTHSQADNASAWLARVQSHGSRFPQADTPRSQWIVQSKSADRRPDFHDRIAKWLKNTDNAYKPIAEHYRNRDDFNIHYQIRDPLGNVAAVPEPSGLAVLAGPSIGALLYWRRRRSA